MDMTVETVGSDSLDSGAPLLGLDRSLNAAAGMFIGGMSPTALHQAWWDWSQHLSVSVDKQTELVWKAVRKWYRFGAYCERTFRDPQCERCLEPLPQDERFRGEPWQHWPFNALYQGFLLQQQWWHVATTGVPGVSRHHEAMVNFGARQCLDVFSPSNFLTTNPELIERTLQEGGRISSEVPPTSGTTDGGSWQGSDRLASNIIEWGGKWR